MSTINTRIRLLFSTLEEIEAENPVLLEGEQWTEKDGDTGQSTGRRKIGDGVTAFNSLPFEPGGSGGSATDLSIANRGATTLQVASSTGADATVPAATGSLAGLLTAADKAKLDGVAAGATANATDAQLRDRSTHTGTQAAGTITGLATVATSGAYADLSGRPTLGGAAALNVGTGAGTVAAGDDSRLSDARTPVAHNQAWSTITSTPTTLGGYGITDATPSSHVGAGGTAHADVVAGGAAGFMSGADKAKLNGVATGATANATDAQLRDRSTHTGTQAASTISDFNAEARGQVEATLVAGSNITLTPSGSGASRQITIAAESAGPGGATDLSIANRGVSTLDVASSSGADATLPAATNALAGLATAAQITKLEGIATGATANATDAQLRDRSTHTGTQAWSTITSTPTTLSGYGITDATPSSHVGAGGTAHADVVAGGAAGFMSGADKTKLDGIASGATANSSDATLLARANHTGTQAASTISDFNAEARGQVESALVAGSNITLTPSGSGASRQITVAATGGASYSDATPQSLGATASAGTAASASRSDHVHQRDADVIVLACSDETTALTTGTNRVRFRMPYAATLLAVRASVNTAPTGSALIVDINEAGSSVLGTKLSIDATETSSTTAASAATITDSSLADDAEISIDIDQVGSTVAGAGLKVALTVRRA